MSGWIVFIFIILIAHSIRATDLTKRIEKLEQKHL